MLKGLERFIAANTQGDSGRNAPQVYEWDKIGKPTVVHSPSGTKMAWDHNYAGENSDMDKIIRVKRSGRFSITLLWCQRRVDSRRTRKNLVA